MSVCNDKSGVLYIKYIFTYIYVRTYVKLVQFFVIFLNFFSNSTNQSTTSPANHRALRIYGFLLLPIYNSVSDEIGYARLACFCGRTPYRYI